MKGRFVELWVQAGAVIPTRQYGNSQPMAGIKVALDVTEDKPLTLEDIKQAYDAAWDQVADQIYNRIQEIDDAVKNASKK